MYWSAAAIDSVRSLCLMVVVVICEGGEDSGLHKPPQLCYGGSQPAILTAHPDWILIQHEHTHRTGYFRAARGSGRAAVGRPDPALAAEFRHFGRTPAA